MALSLVLVTDFGTGYAISFLVSLFQLKRMSGFSA